MEKPTLEQLQAMLAQFNAAEVKALLKKVETEKPTMLSVTMDAIVAGALANDLKTDTVSKAVTAKAREHGLLEANEDATQSSVAQLIRHTRAFDDAMSRAGYEWTKKAAPEAPAAPETGDSTPPANNAPSPPPSASADKDANKRRAA